MQAGERARWLDKPRRRARFRCSAALLLSVTLVLAACGKDQTDAARDLSAAPSSLATGKRLDAAVSGGVVGLNLTVPFAVLQTLFDEQVAMTTPVRGRDRVCKRLLGIKTCGDAVWDVAVKRGQRLSMQSFNGAFVAQLPLTVDGWVGIEGGVADVLGLSRLNIDGAMVATLASSLALDANWCPSVSIESRYQWSRKPTLTWNNTFDFSLESVVNSAIDREMQKLQQSINTSLDCAGFRQTLARYWTAHSIPLALPGDESAYLNIDPRRFAFSGLQAHDEAVAASFMLDAALHVGTEALVSDARALPALQTALQPSQRTEFDLVVRLGYPQLDAILNSNLVGRRFEQRTAAGRVAATIRHSQLSGSEQGLALQLDFDAELPGSKNPQAARVFLVGRPVLDRQNNTLSLVDLDYTQVIDSGLWQLLGGLFDSQIVAAIERAAVLDLDERMTALEQRLIEQLANPERTRGFAIAASDVDLAVTELAVEADAVAARVRFSSVLDVQVTEAALTDALGSER